MKTFKIFWIIILLYDILINCTCILPDRCALYDDTLLRFKREEMAQLPPSPQALRAGPAVGTMGKGGGKPTFYDDIESGPKNVQFSNGIGSGQNNYGGSQGLGSSGVGNVNSNANNMHSMNNNGGSSMDYGQSGQPSGMSNGYGGGGYGAGGYGGGGYMDYGGYGMHGGMHGGGLAGALGGVAGMVAPMMMSGMMNGGGGAMPPMMPPMGGNTGGLDDNDITPPRGSNHNDHPSDKIDNKISNDDMTKHNQKNQGNNGLDDNNPQKGTGSRWDVVKNRQNDIIKQGNGLGEQIQGQRPANNGNRRGWGLLRGRTNDIINQGAGSNGLGGQGTQANGNHLGLNGNRGDVNTGPRGSMRGQGPGSGGGLRGPIGGPGTGGGPMGQERGGRRRWWQRGNRNGLNGSMNGPMNGPADQGPRRGLFGSRRGGVDNTGPQGERGSFGRRRGGPAPPRPPRIRGPKPRPFRLGGGGGIFKFFRG